MSGVQVETLKVDRWFTSPMTMNFKEERKMGLEAQELKELIIDTLWHLSPDIPYSESAVELLMLTAAAETHCGSFLRQKDGGPAYGVFQMEWDTEDDIWEHYLEYPKQESLANKMSILHGVGIVLPTGKRETPLRYNLAYMIAMARVHYRRVPEPLPAADDVKGLAEYWKAHWNTNLGKGTVDKAIRLYEIYGEV